MATVPAVSGLHQQLRAFKKKYYLNQLLRGLIFSGGLWLSVYLLYTVLEYFFTLPYGGRAFLFFSYLAVLAFGLGRWIIPAVAGLLELRKDLSDAEAAKQVGQFFPEIQDKLLNTLQLEREASANSLIQASLEQKSKQLSVFRFTDAVRLEENKSRLKYLYIPLGVLVLLGILYPSLLVQSTTRIVQYNRSFAPQAPFEFEVLNDELTAFRNEDFPLEVEVKGKILPSELYINYQGRRQLLQPKGNGKYEFTFKNLQKPVNFQLEGAGFFSEEYALELLGRPNLRSFSVNLNYPKYLGKSDETVANTGNLTVPEGTKVQWNFSASETQNVSLQFEEPKAPQLATRNGDRFVFTRQVFNTEPYSVKLRNEHSTNKEDIAYTITTIPDRSPDINVEQYRDTLLFNYLMVGGSISDDYGFTRLSLHYRMVSGDKQGAFKSKPLALNKQQLGQTYYYQWQLDTLQLKAGDKLEYFVQVWDNDGIHGPKAARTRTLEFKLPTREELRKDLSQNAKSVESQMSKSLQDVNKLQKDLEKLEEKLKTKKELNWQDKKQLEDLLKNKKELEQQLNQMEQLSQQMNQKQERFQEQSPQIAEKTKQLQELMRELLDDETKKLYEELERLMQQERPNQEELQKMLDKIDMKEDNLQKELDRALEMFKQLQMEQKLEQAIEKLKELAEKQEDAGEKNDKSKDDKAKDDKSDKADDKNKSDDKKGDDKKGSEQKDNKPQSKEDAQKEQQKLNEEFKETREDLKELQEMNKDLKEPAPMEDTKPQEESIEQEQQKSSEQLQSGSKSKAGKSQKSAAQKMEQLAQKMEQMKQEQQQQDAEEDMDALRDILENLITLSFDQEALMKDFRNISQSDPRFIQLSQQQLKLKDDSKMIEDSLLALAKRVFQIKSFVTREVALVKENIDHSVEQIKERNVPRANGHQQMAMTSINNLALMLNDVLKQMQQQMANQKPGDQMCSKPGGKKPKLGSMGQLQQQLNQKIQDLKKSGKSGQAMSEELAKLAAQQEALRKALKEMEKGQQKPGGKKGEGQNGNLGELGKMMEQTETDLVNKRLTDQTIMRQRDIMTRLLEAEKAARERDLDDKREAESAKQRPTPMPPSLEKYLQAKQKQTELLKTISPAMSPYYKQEVNEYFQKLGK